MRRFDAMTPPLERFYRYVTPGATDECWLWTGWLNSHGYGRFYLNCWIDGHYLEKVNASRASLLLHIGQPNDWSQHACHHCDNPPCVNPNHLYWGDQKSNVGDMVNRGRASGGRAKETHCQRGHPYTRPPGPKGSTHYRCEICEDANRARKLAARRSRYRVLRDAGYSPTEAQRLSARRLPVDRPPVTFQGEP